FSKLPELVKKIVYNRPLTFVSLATKNYFSNWSPRYLFFRGGSHYQFSLPYHELLFLVTAPFLLIGLIKSLIKGNREEKLILLWAVCGFLPSAITKDAPHVLRSLFSLPPMVVLAMIGLFWLVSFLRSRSKLHGNLILIVFVIAVLVSFIRWWKDYWQVYPRAYSWAWQYGYPEVVSFIKDNYSNYGQIFLTKRYGEPHEFVLFNFPWNPLDYQNDPLRKWDYHSEWFWVDGFAKFVFLNDWDVGYQAKCPPSEKCLLVTSPDNYSQDWKKIKTIYFLEGKPAFDILENN
ncbi:MAG: hypothetical protein M1514_02235, partial [Patescibacteria group bacterium]|nr:hypothetical protein [Patescibacteria group bacterium]